jgi:hypothetical protein
MVFAVQDISFLSNRVSLLELYVNPDLSWATKRCPTSEDVKGVPRFIGVVSSSDTFILYFVDIAFQLKALRKKRGQRLGEEA